MSLNWKSNNAFVKMNTAASTRVNEMNAIRKTISIILTNHRMFKKFLLDSCWFLCFVMKNDAVANYSKM